MKWDLFEVCKKLARPFITFGVIIILSIMASATVAFTIGGNDGKTWAQFGIGFLLQALMIILWIPEGKERGKKNEVYVANKNCANKQIMKYSAPQYFVALDKFCEYAYTVNVKNWITERVNGRNADYNRYIVDAEYALTLDEKTKRKICRIETNAKKRVKRIKSTEITSNTQIDLVYDIGDHTKSVERTKVILRLIPSFVMSSVGASITFLAEPFSWNTIALLVYWIVTICTTIVFSLKTGYDLITKTGNDHSLRIIDFLTRFEGWIIENGIEIRQNVEKETVADE